MSEELNYKISKLIELSQLFVDFLNHIQIVRVSEKSGFCAEKKGANTWTCCDFHKHLQATFEELKQRAERISPPSSNEQIPTFCPTWWKKRGFSYPKKEQ